MAKNKWNLLSKILPTAEELKQWPMGLFDNPKNWNWKKWEEDWLWPVVSEKQKVNKDFSKGTSKESLFIFKMTL